MHAKSLSVFEPFSNEKLATHLFSTQVNPGLHLGLSPPQAPSLAAYFLHTAVSPDPEQYEPNLHWLPEHFPPSLTASHLFEVHVLLKHSYGDSHFSPSNKRYLTFVHWLVFEEFSISLHTFPFEQAST